jgi:hypothetical protein
MRLDAVAGSGIMVPAGLGRSRRRLKSRDNRASNPRATSHNRRILALNRPNNAGTVITVRYDYYPRTCDPRSRVTEAEGPV